MSIVTLGVIGFILLCVLILLRLPVAIAMATVGFAGFAYIVGLHQALSIIAMRAYTDFANYTFGAVIMFILMGFIAFHSGLSEVLYQSFHICMGSVRAGLAAATTVTCTAFGAICGSTIATTATIGVVAIPEMRKYKYDDGLSTSVVAASGILGTMIPPSTPLILYGLIVSESIAKLFIATIVPGLLLCACYLVTSYALSLGKKNRAPGAEKSSIMYKIKSVVKGGTLEVVIVFLVVLLGMFGGVFTPTESGAVGSGALLGISILRRRMTWKRFTASLRDTTKTAAMIFVMLMGAGIFGNFISASRLPMELTAWCGSLGVHPIIIIMLLMLMQLVMGCFMDGMVVMMLTLPIVYPVAVNVGYSTLWLGPLMVLMAGIGMITPPVGVNLFIVHGIAKDVPLEKTFKTVWWYVLASMILVVLLVVFPEMVTFLPEIVAKM